MESRSCAILSARCPVMQSLMESAVKTMRYRREEPAPQNPLPDPPRAATQPADSDTHGPAPTPTQISEPATFALRDCEQFLKTLMQVLPVGVHVKRVWGDEAKAGEALDLLMWNRAAESMFALEAAQASGRIPHFSLPAKVARVQVAHEALLREAAQPTPESTIAMHRNDGQLQTLRMRSYPILDAEGKVAYALSVTEDVTALSEAKHDASKATRIDDLTGLANRAGFFESLKVALARARRAGTGIAVLFLDIDDFSKLNNGLGDARGDLILQQFGARLKQAVRATDSVARLAGDEFAVIVETLHSLAEAELVTQKVLAALGEPWILDGEVLSITTSAGIAYDQTHAHSAPALIGYADEMLYVAKTDGGNSFRITSC
jgi:diguanylate cyclase (GGDEF)-like protein